MASKIPYDVFAVLANVRNGFGFAGVNTGDGFLPLSEPRGLPGDIAINSHKYLSGQHSPSWLLLSEVLATDDYWNRVTTKRGWVTAGQYHQMTARGDKQPREWCGDVTGGRVRHLQPDEMDMYLKVGFPDLTLSYYCPVDWQVTYREACESLWRVIPDIQRIDYGCPDRIRLVFDFDS